jgi:epoxyqueuosine reductase
MDLDELKRELHTRARQLGFSELGVASIELPEDERHLMRWLEAGFHGDMEYMQRHGTMRSRPQELAPGTVRVISVRMDYCPSRGDAR